MATTTYFWDPTTDAVTEEYDGTGTVQATYTRRPEMYGPLISQNRGGNTGYYHFDALGSTRALTDDTQTVTDSYTYDAWGNEVASSGGTVNTQRWVGMWGYSLVSILLRFNVRSRNYLFTTASWNSTDPAWSPDWPYRYASNSPVIFTDPSGERAGIGLDAGYGKFCGPFRKALCLGVDNPSPANAPIDNLDKACMIHDCCLFGPWEFITRQLQCNCAFCAKANNWWICEGSPKRLQCEAYRLAILNSPFCKPLGDPIPRLPVNPIIPWF